MSPGRDLAVRLTSIIDHDLTMVKRLSGEETWIGPTAESMRNEFQGLQSRLLLILDDVINHDRLSDALKNS